METIGQTTLSLLLFAPGLVLLVVLAILAYAVHRERVRRAEALAAWRVAAPAGPGRIVEELKAAISAALDEAKRSHGRK